MFGITALMVCNSHERLCDLWRNRVFVFDLKQSHLTIEVRAKAPRPVPRPRSTVQAQPPPIEAEDPYGDLKALLEDGAP